MPQRIKRILFIIGTITLAIVFIIIAGAVAIVMVCALGGLLLFNKFRRREDVHEGIAEFKQQETIIDADYEIVEEEEKREN